MGRDLSNVVMRSSPAFLGAGLQRDAGLAPLPVNGEGVAERHGAIRHGGLTLGSLALGFFEIRQAQFGDGDGCGFERAHNQLALNAKECRIVPG